MPAEEIADFAGVLAAAQSGDEAAFICLFRTVQPALLRYLRSQAPDLAADVAAETWYRVVRDLRRFTGTEPGFRGWVFTIARARLLDAHRAVRRRPEVPVPELPDRAGDDDVADTVEEVLSTERALALIAILPPAQREALLLRVVAGLDVATTARLLQLTANHVRVLTHRGLRRLATLVGDPPAAVMPTEPPEVSPP